MTNDELFFLMASCANRKIHDRAGGRAEAESDKVDLSGMGFIGLVVSPAAAGLAELIFAAEFLIGTRKMP